MDYPELSLLIDGVWCGRDGREVLPVHNPATGAVLGELPMATLADLDAALDGADRAFRTWRRTPAHDRAQVLTRAADLLRERAHTIGRLTTQEQGKPVGEATAEVYGAADILDWFAEEGRRSYGRIVPSRSVTARNLVIKEPVGPVAAFTPWNMPMTIPARKLGGALAAGCTVVLKPAEETPATGLALAAALVDAGLPAGVLSVVYGDPAVIAPHLIRSPVVRKVTFTGSTAIGKRIAGWAAEGVKRATLELGGHAPVLVFDDATIPRAVAMTVAGKFRNAGQICLSPTRFLVQEGVHDAFAAQFTAAAAALHVGNGLEPGVQMGPLLNARRVAAIAELVEDAVDQGATVATGGRAGSSEGHFWEPTVLTGVDPAIRAMNTEPFGPLALITPFRTFDEGVALANRLPFGLAAYAFTSSLATARGLAESVETGMLGINDTVLIGPETPFGGVKESGYGSEGGSEGLEDYLSTKYVREAS